MEHKFYTDNFERLLKEKSDEFRMYPSKRVWHSIYNDLHPGRKWPSFAISLVLVSVLFLIGYWNNQLDTVNPNSGNKSIQTASAKTNQGVETFAGNSTELQPVTKSSLSAPGAGNYNSQPSVNDNGSQSINNRYRNTVSITSITESSLTDDTQISNDYSNAQDYKFPDNATIITTEAEKNVFSSIKNAESGINGKQDKSGNLNSSKVSIADAEEENNGLTTTQNDLVEKLEKLKLADANNNVKAAENVNTVKAVSKEEKSWMEHFVMYNKKNKHKGLGRFANEIYFAPGITLRKMTNSTDVTTVTPSPVTVLSGSQIINTNTPAYIPALSFEVGMNFSYSLSKNVKLKAGLLAGFTNYSIAITELNHPVLTTVLLKNTSTGAAYLEPRATSIANVPGFNNKKIHNQTSQISIPLGMAVKLAGSKKVDWYVATSIQPTYVFSGKTNLISADHYNYISDASMLRNWNMNAAVESYIHYKTGNTTFQVGPELRTQLFSTYSNKYSYSEKLYNLGIKAGIVRNF